MALGIEPMTIVIPDDDAIDEVAYVISANLIHRNLSKQQRRQIRERALGFKRELRDFPERFEDDDEQPKDDGFNSTPR
jgi:hypothetical protein